jgi:hypothetical protein
LEHQAQRIPARNPQPATHRDDRPEVGAISLPSGIHPTSSPIWSSKSTSLTCNDHRRISHTGTRFLFPGNQQHRASSNSSTSQSWLALMVPPMRLRLPMESDSGREKANSLWKLGRIQKFCPKMDRIARSARISERKALLSCEPPTRFQR